jgi:hypothetical protein
LILLAVPFVLQLLASIFSCLPRDGSAGAATGLLATTWLGLGLLQLSSGSGRPRSSVGLMLVSSGGVLMLSAPVIASAKPLPGAVFSLPPFVLPWRGLSAERGGRLEERCPGPRAWSSALGRRIASSR